MRLTDRYVVAGNPVAHSQSPFIHASFAEQTGEPVIYERLLCPMDRFAQTVRDFAQAGGRGCNVTVPFKADASRLAARVTDRAALAGAANLLRFDAQGWFADNTDGVGLVRDIERNAGLTLAGKRVLLVGAGGGAAGALGPLLLARPATLVVANRTLDKAQDLARRHAELAQVSGVSLSASTLGACPPGFDVVINATATSLTGAGVPVHPQVLASGGALALDMMYGRAADGYLAWAAQHGARGRDGLGMLVEQAAEAFFVWRGVRPDTSPVLAALVQHVATGLT
jgi:shikimate dehydrogenase